MTPLVGALAFAIVLAAPTVGLAQQQWALVVSGASGGPTYAEQQRGWRAAIATALVERYGFVEERVRVLTDETVRDGLQGTAENVRRTLAEFRRGMGREDLLLIVLLGHGTFDGDVAKFNLVGPDLTAAEWAGLLEGLPGRVALVNTTASSYPFLQELSSRGRIVITATDSVAQRYWTVFPEYFVRALDAASTDLNKDGRTSVWELFEATSLAVRQHYEQRAQLTTERAVIDDVGDGVGREAHVPGPHGALARRVFLDAEDPALLADPELAELVRRRRVLEAEAEDLRQQKDSMEPEAWLEAFEKLMIDLARVSRQIRQRSS
jgi:hypothetical protein